MPNIFLVLKHRDTFLPHDALERLQRLKNWSAAVREARFCAMSASRRLISSRSNCTRRPSSSTESNVRSCPISCVTFFFGLSSSSIAGTVDLLQANFSHGGFGCHIDGARL